MRATGKRKVSLFAYCAVRFKSRPVGREGCFYSMGISIRYLIAQIKRQITRIPSVARISYEEER